MAGRPPKPTALKLATGNPGKRPLNALEPTPVLGLPKPPAWMPERVRPFWDELGAIVVRMGVMTEADGPALAMFASLMADAAEAMKEGPVRKEIHSEIRAYCTKFGITPADRVRVKVAEPEKKESVVASFLRLA